MPEVLQGEQWERTKDFDAHYINAQKQSTRQHHENNVQIQNMAFYMIDKQHIDA